MTAPPAKELGAMLALLQDDMKPLEDDDARLGGILAAVNEVAPTPAAGLPGGLALPASIGAGAIALFVASRATSPSPAAPRFEPAETGVASSISVAPAGTVEPPPADNAAPTVSVDSLPSVPTALASRVVAPSAAELFAEANRLRDEGKTADAQNAYAKLRSLHPASSEAQIATVSSAQLWLSNGDAGRALTLFDAALRSGDRRLREEALVGRARSLEALGRRDDEVVAWRAVVQEYPLSSWKSHAQSRIDAP